MKIHYKGKYNLDPETLPSEPHKEGAVKFKEAEDTKKLALIANTIAVVIAVVTLAAVFFRCGRLSIIGFFLPLLFLFPHEILHAICFRRDSYIYSNLKQGMLFVIGTEDMSRARFVFMSLLPNIVFGLIPFVISMIFPSMYILGTFGAFSLSMGAGDFYNVYNAMTQMPRGARTYLHKFNSYWYMPQ